MSFLNSDPATRPSLLIRLQNARDQEAWAEFTAVYEPVIYRMTRRRGMQDADACEVVQEVLISVVGSIKKFDVNTTGTFRGWLGRITRNAAIDRMRRIAARLETIDAEGAIAKLDQNAYDESVGQEFDQDRREQLFRWAASEVRRRTGETNWMAFWRTAIDGASTADVAHELGVSEGSVYVARCRILKRIRELVDARLAE